MIFKQKKILLNKERFYLYNLWTRSEVVDNLNAIVSSSYLKHSRVMRQK